MTDETNEAVELSLDIAELTLGQVEFLCDYSGLDIDGIQVCFEKQQLTLKLMIASIALAHSQDDPAAGLEYARTVKIGELAGLAPIASA